jgi:PAS domain S-box-containing protein
MSGLKQKRCAMSLSTGDDNLEVFRLIVEQAPDAVIFADRRGKIQIWNNAAANLFGYSLDEALGQSLDIIIPDRLRDAHWKSFGVAVATGHTKHGSRALKTRATHKSRQTLHVRLAFSVVKDHEGNAIGALATAREFVEKP